MAEQQLEKAVALIKQGNKKEAIQIAKTILQQDRNNVKAWWFMANLLEKPEQKEKAAQKILELQPEHSGAKKLLASLKGTQPQKPEPAAMKTSQHDWSKLDAHEARQEKIKSKAKSTNDDDVMRKATYVIIACLALPIVVGIILAVGSLFGGGSTQGQLSRLVRNFYTKVFEFDMAGANQYVCRAEQFSQREIDQFDAALAIIGNFELEADLSDLSVEIISRDGDTIIGRLSGSMTVTTIDRGETTTETVTIDEYLAGQGRNGRDALDFEFVRENGSWRICTAM